MGRLLVPSKECAVLRNCTDLLRRLLSGCLSVLILVGLSAGPVLATDEVEAHEHTYTTVEVVATCTDPGLILSVCTVCGVEEITEIPALGHDYDQGFCLRCGAEDPNHTAEPAPSDPEAAAPEDPEDPSEEEDEEEPKEVSAHVEPAASYSEGHACEYYAETLPGWTLFAFGHLDRGYRGCAVTNLTAGETQAIKNAILLSQGEDPVGCMAAAQVIHDQYVYLGGAFWSFRSVKNLINGWWDPAAWSTEWVNPEGLDTTAAEDAFDYIFRQGNAFLPHNMIMLAQLPAPDWDPQELAPGTEPLGVVRLLRGEGETAETVYLGLWGYSPCDSDADWSRNPNAALTWSTGSAATTREEIQEELLRLLYDSDEGIVTCDFDSYSEIEGRHEGIDFALEEDCPLYAITDGVILRISRSPELTTLAVYDEAADKTVVYLHLAISEGLEEGGELHRGDFIGTESSYGASGAHTHVEVVEGESGWANISVADGKEGAGYELAMTLENEDPYYYWSAALTGVKAEGVLGHMADGPVTITWPWPGLQALLPEPTEQAATSKTGGVKTGSLTCLTK